MEMPSCSAPTSCVYISPKLLSSDPFVTLRFCVNVRLNCALRQQHWDGPACDQQLIEVARIASQALARMIALAPFF